jgi:hypothetical protein
MIMPNTKLKVPEFLKLDETTKKELLEKVASSSMPEKERLVALESMTFLDNFHKQLKNDPTITLKKVKELLDLHVERLKKTLLAH